MGGGLVQHADSQIQHRDTGPMELVVAQCRSQNTIMLIMGTPPTWYHFLKTRFILKVETGVSEPICTSCSNGHGCIGLYSQNPHPKTRNSNP